MKNVTLVAVLAAVLLLFTIAASPSDVSDELPTALEFKTKTVAICEDREDSVYCHDELVVNCEGKEYVLPKTEEIVKCGSLTLQASPITAFAVFGSGWKDPRAFAE